MTRHEWEVADRPMNAVTAARRDACRLCGVTSMPDHNTSSAEREYRLTWADGRWQRCPDSCEETAVMTVCSE